MLATWGVQCPKEREWLQKWYLSFLFSTWFCYSSHKPTVRLCFVSKKFNSARELHSVAQFNLWFSVCPRRRPSVSQFLLNFFSQSVWSRGLDPRCCLPDKLEKVPAHLLKTIVSIGDIEPKMLMTVDRRRKCHKKLAEINLCKYKRQQNERNERLPNTQTFL